MPCMGTHLEGAVSSLLKSAFGVVLAECALLYAYMYMCM